MSDPEPLNLADTAVSGVIRCCNCNQVFSPRRAWSAFCTNDCRTAFYNRMKRDGASLAPLVKSWIATRHAPKGSPEARVCAYARSELTIIATALLAADSAEHRGRAADYVAQLMEKGVRAVDRLKSDTHPFVTCNARPCRRQRRTANREWICREHLLALEPAERRVLYRLRSDIRARRGDGRAVFDAMCTTAFERIAERAFGIDRAQQ